MRRARSGWRSVRVPGGYADGRADDCRTTDPCQLGLDGGRHRGICDASFGDDDRPGKRIHQDRGDIDDPERAIRSLEDDDTDAGDSAERACIGDRIEGRREAIDDLRQRILATLAFGEVGDLLMDVFD